MTRSLSNVERQKGKIDMERESNRGIHSTTRSRIRRELRELRKGKGAEQRMLLMRHLSVFEAMKNRYVNGHVEI